MKTKTPPLKWSIARACKEFGVSRDTIARGLSSLGVKSKDGYYTTRDIFRAIGGDAKYERTRLLMAKAKLAEIEVKEREGELVNGDKLHARIFQEIIAPLKSTLNRMPLALAHLCNPQNPELAKTVLTHWWENTKKDFRETATSSKRQESSNEENQIKS